jgi:hypothetical protein
MRHPESHRTEALVTSESGYDGRRLDSPARLLSAGRRSLGFTGSADERVECVSELLGDLRHGRHATEWPPPSIRMSGDTFIEDGRDT